MDKEKKSIFLPEDANVTGGSSDGVNQKAFKFIDKLNEHEKDNSDSDTDKSERSETPSNDSQVNITTNESDTAEPRKAEHKIHISRNKRYCLYWVLIISSVFLNTDHGTIPAAIAEIQESLGISKTELGSFGSAVYVGTAVGALFLSFTINKLNRRLMIGISYFCSGVLLLWFTFLTNVYGLFLNRMMVGFCQSLVSIYIPVWIDQYIPLAYKTVLMAIFQLSSLLGIVIGYCLTFAVKQKYDVIYFIFYIIISLFFYFI